jgi:hypothetical protein
MALFGGARPSLPPAARGPFAALAMPPPAPRQAAARYTASHSIAGVLDSDARPRLNQDKVVIHPALLRQGTRASLHTRSRELRCRILMLHQSTLIFVFFNYHLMLMDVDAIIG